MAREKEKRLLERTSIPELNGKVEVDGNSKDVFVLDATEDGVCIAGAEIPVGDVVLVCFEHPQMSPEISLYAKSVWASNLGKEKKSGLSFLHTNKVLFKEDLTSFSELVGMARSAN